ncbi:YidH family protein [Vibrio agarivorans]|uniref:YidH family protein n=1 Tax=Vibrio agarivorans TaxID=153622 RepID=UPI0025B3F087|nr:DUF202 domain-containing protein [Vibrio agarivorans]MDN3660511.1 DUF202 domain-containing protein [Vibrio agarivorans]
MPDSKPLNTPKENAPLDYRFSLANERTYLAWVRTALALVAAAIGIDQLTPDLAEPAVRIALSTCLCLLAGTIAVYSYLRWQNNENAMINQVPLVRNKLNIIISVVLLTLIFTIITLILY